jgi:hypothetical protein
VGRWPIWDLRSATKRWEMFCDATACRARRSASARPNGRPSFRPTWRCWRGPTFHGAVLTLRGLATYYSYPSAAIGRSRKPRQTLRYPLCQLTRFGKLATSYQLQVLPPFQFFDHTGGLAPLRSKNCKHRAELLTLHCNSGAQSRQAVMSTTRSLDQDWPPYLAPAMLRLRSNYLTTR